jgi:hypothetical protein
MFDKNDVKKMIPMCMGEIKQTYFIKKQVYNLFITAGD